MQHPFNLAAHVLAAGEAKPEATALELVSPGGKETWSYGKLIAAVRGTATGLLQLGLAPGDRVLLRLGNTPDFPIAYLGALAADLVPVPTSAALTEAEVARLISVVTPKIVLRDPAVRCPSDARTVDLESLQDWYELPPADYALGDPERLGYIIFTSGTSGTPHAVMHAHRAILGRQMMFDGWYGLRATDRLLHAGAFNWTYTLGTGLMDLWTLGATAVVPRAGTPPAALPDLLQVHHASIFAASPGIYRQILKHCTSIDAPALRHGLSAGEKLPDAVRSSWEEATGTPVFEAFGMSECSTFISGSPDCPARPGTLGRPQPGRQVSLRENGSAVPTGSAGTIAIHEADPGLMLGYWNAPESTANRFDGPWFLTGDQGIADEAGHITYLGRVDDMMNAGGVRVSPVEVEQALTQLSGIQAAAAAEVEVKPGTTVIAAFYTGTQLSEAELKAHCSATLARYKQPRIFVHLDQLPVSGNGKISRRALRDSFEANDP